MFNNLITTFMMIGLIILVGCQNKPSTDLTVNETPIPKGSFMGIMPTDTPVILYPGFINSPSGEYNGTFNPGGTEFFYTVSNNWHNVVVHTQLKNDGSWSKPSFAPFSVKHDEFDPLFAPDGKSLYYSSHRPIVDTLNSSPSNIWKVEMTESGWSNPILIPLYGPRKGNYFSSLTSDGSIYFNIWNNGNMYKAEPVDTGYVIKELGEKFIGSKGDGDPFIAPDESYLIFRSRNRGGLGAGDLWITFNIEGKWSEPENLGEPINSRYHEMCPYVTTDGKLFIFSSSRFKKPYFNDDINNLDDVQAKLSTWDNGQQNIYTMSADFIEDFRRKAIEAVN